MSHSLTAIAGHEGKSQSIARGRAWGEYVANQILELRSADGWFTPPPPYLGTFDPAVWRSIAFAGNPDGTVAAAFAQNAILAPSAMAAPSQFRPGPPYAPTLTEALASAQYAADLNEVRAIGRVNSATRTWDQTELARLWQAIGPIDENRAARSVVHPGNSLVENARLFALLNMATCDALIASMDSKFAYGLWRPHHAISLADTDGNPGTLADPDWSALILAPRFSEYVSNHASPRIRHSVAISGRGTIGGLDTATVDEAGRAEKERLATQRQPFAGCSPAVRLPQALFAGYALAWPLPRPTARPEGRSSGA